MTNDNPLSLLPDFEEPTVRRIVGTLVALTGLLLVLGLVTVLPSIDRLVEGLTVTPAALATAIATLLVVAALLWVAPAVERAVRQGLDGPWATVGDAAVSAKLLVVFVAVVVAYRGLAGAVTPSFEAFGMGGIYHLVFLFAGLVALGALTRRLVRCWRPVTDLLTDHAMTALGSDRVREVSTE